MGQRVSNFNRVAPFYDAMANVIFGGAIRRSQIEFLEHIKPGSTVLILGGGTGWILTELFKRAMPDKVYYLEASTRMLHMAKQKCANESVIFLQGTQYTIPQHIQLDIVITNFYLDVFDDNTLSDTIKHIQKSLKQNALWLVSDFVERNWWHQLLLALMYAFFNLVTNLQNRKLPPWENQLHAIGMLRKRKCYYRRFIESRVYVIT
jgi:tRNA (cmo5U34)-methyltransferase